MRLIVTLIDVYSFVILIAVILSWVPVNRRHLLIAILHGVTEPVLAPSRRVLQALNVVIAASPLPCASWTSSRPA